MRHTNVHLLDPEQEEPSSPPDCEIETAEIYDDGYYVAVINMANDTDKWGQCFNYRKEGHRWAECTELLKEFMKVNFVCTSFRGITPCCDLLGYFAFP